MFISDLKAAVAEALARRLFAATGVKPLAEFSGVHTNPAKRGRRALLKIIGRRQLLKRVKTSRRAAMQVAA